MITVSLCMIVKNEEQTLARCLSSAAEAMDEIVILDTGSSDRTKETAARFGARVFDFPWCDDFSAARNASYERATMEYIFWMDADDILREEDVKKLKRLKETLNPSVDIVMMRYHTAFDDQERPTFTYFRERLSKRSQGFRWQEPVHEYLQFYGQVEMSDIAVCHAKPPLRVEKRDAGRNLRIYENRLATGEILTPRGSYYYARELRDHGRFREAASQYTRFLDDGQGWVEDNITACGDLAHCLLTLGEETAALQALYRSFVYDAPRGEICCQLGYYYKGKEEFRRAAFWFSLPLLLTPPTASWGFVQPDFWGYIPCLECAVCYDRLGDRTRAETFNETAASFKPESPVVEYNRRYFAARRAADMEKKPPQAAQILHHDGTDSPVDSFSRQPKPDV